MTRRTLVLLLLLATNAQGAELTVGDTTIFDASTTKATPGGWRLMVEIPMGSLNQCADVVRHVADTNWLIYCYETVK